MANIPISGNRYTAFRVLTTALPIILIIGITLAVLLGVPAVYGGLRAGWQAGGAIFLIVLAPAFLLALVTTALAIRILWRASDPSPDRTDG